MKLDIKLSKDPILRETTEEVVNFDMDLQKLIDDMVETMREAHGVGLAAPQVGSNKKLLVCEFEGDKEAKLPGFPLTVLCNPTIKKCSEKQKNMVEGCLSFPGIELIVKRPKTVTVVGEDRYGNKIEIQADKLFARVLQHEIDHLNSTLLIDHLQQIDVIFIGTGSLGVPTLKKLAADPQYKIKLVITGDSKSISRKEVSSNYIENIAKELNLNVIKTSNINDRKIIETIKRAKPEIGVMADFGQIIKQEVIDIPKKGIINIHPSLLPKHRGPSPIQQTILDGDKVTGVSLILTSEKMDAGDIISIAKVKLSGTENTTILKNYLADLGATLLLNSLPYYISEDLHPIAQDDSKATYNKLFKKEDGFVDKNTTAAEVERKIRAFSDWPKVYTIVNDKKVQLISSHMGQDNNLVLDIVKPESKKEMTYEEYKRGYKSDIIFS